LVNQLMKLLLPIVKIAGHTHSLQGATIHNLTAP
jgi:hypothetical protein